MTAQTVATPGLFGFRTVFDATGLVVGWLRRTTVDVPHGPGRKVKRAWEFDSADPRTECLHLDTFATPKIAAQEIGKLL